LIAHLDFMEGVNFTEWWLIPIADYVFRNRLACGLCTSGESLYFGRKWYGIAMCVRYIYKL